jgi:hypothetical protein
MPFEVANGLARELGKDLGIEVRATLQIGSAQLQPFPSTRQYEAESIQALALQTIPNLSDKRADSAYIVVTRRDINTKDRSCGSISPLTGRHSRAVDQLRASASAWMKPVTGERFIVVSTRC